MKLNKFYFFIAMLFVSVQAAKAQDKSVNGVLTAYFTLKNDLVADDAATTKTHATELAAAIKAVPADKIAAIVYEAATDGKDQIRYVAGEDAKAMYARRLEIGSEESRKEIRKQILG